MEPKNRKKFDPKLVLDLYDNLTTHNYALRAFGALLESADMENRFGNSGDGMNFRAGLNQIVELYIEHQERKLEKIRMQYYESEDYAISKALNVCDLVHQGAFRTSEIALEEISKALSSLSGVMHKFEDGQNQEAIKARDKLLSAQKAIASYIECSKKNNTEAGIKGKILPIERTGSGHAAGKTAMV